MDRNKITLPEGFELEKTAQLPVGFVIDSSAPEGFEIEKSVIAKDIPASLLKVPSSVKGIGEFGEAIVSGATLGISEKVSQAGEYLSEKLMRKIYGDKYKEIPKEEDVLPSYARVGGELAGAIVPVGAAGKVIATPIIKAVSKSKYLQPFARMIGWGTAGGAYSTAESMVSEGELPSPKEIAKHGAAWAAFEGVISSLGWGGRLTLGVNRLSKLWNVPRKEVLKTVIGEARARKMPIARYAYAKAGVQKALSPAEVKSAGEFVIGIERLVETGKKIKPPKPVAKGKFQGLYDTLTGKKKSDVKLRLNKYAGSINITKQKVKQPYKEFEKEVSALTPKRTQTWEQTEKLGRKIVADPLKGTKVLTKARKGEGLTAAEIDAGRQINVNAIGKLKEIAETSPEKVNEHFANYVDDIFKPLSNASSEVGRALNIHKKEISVQRIAKAFTKIKKGLNARQLKEFKELNLENPLEVKRFLDRLPDPKFRDYFYEYWYNSILSGVPTHIVNVASNTGWAAFQLGIHRPLKAFLDIPIAALTGRQRRYYLNETIPALIGYGKAFRKGMRGAGQMVKKGNISEFETKWAREIGSSVLGAFERSPHKGLRKIAPLISAPTRALRAMDIWANTMAYDSHLAALARRAANQKGLKGVARKTFERELMLNPTATMRMKSTEFAKHLTFTDDPGKFTEWIIQGRDKIPFGRLIIPFVNTIANLTKRGIEMTPGMGLLLAKGKEPAKILAKQIEGSVLGLYILSKCDKGEITGSAPDSTAARKAFFRQGKKPWAIKIGDTWYQYRRIEPFNTVIASVAIAYNEMKNAKDDKTATDIFGAMVEGLMENVIDSSYLQGVTNILDRYGRREGMLQRTTASFVPYSSFWRSINRAYDVATEGKTLVRDTRSLMGAFSQVIPGLSDKAPAKLTVWGEEIPIEGGIFRQWLPYKWSKEKEDTTEKMLESLEIYPGHPRQRVTINRVKIKLPDDLYKEYCLSYGYQAKKILDKIIARPNFKQKNDELKKAQINNVLTTIRNHELGRAKYEYMKRTRMPLGFVIEKQKGSIPSGFVIE